MADMKPTRRTLLKAAGAAPLALASASAAPAEKIQIPGPRQESATTPKICLEMGSGALAAGDFNDAGFRRVRQLGVSYALSGGPRMPWTEDESSRTHRQVQGRGITLYNLMIGGFPKTIYGQPGRDEEIENVRKSLRAAGKAGLPVVEYNFYAHRAMEGYYEEAGRAGAGLHRVRLRPHERPAAARDEGAHTSRRDVEQHHLFPEGGDPGGGGSGRAHGAASERSAGAAQPRIGADHGHGGRLEEADRDRQQPFERHHVRLRRDARDGRGSGGSVPLLRFARPHQSRAFPQCAASKSRTRSTRKSASTKARWTCSRVMKELVRNKYTRTDLSRASARARLRSRTRRASAGYPGGGGYAAFAFNVGYARAMLQAVLSTL